VVCHACKVQYDVDQIEHYRHPRVLHVAEFVCPQGHIATSRRVFTSVETSPRRSAGRRLNRTGAEELGLR
jgi:hypothetical protein